jgi:CRP-like cAMP-binding protein
MPTRNMPHLLNFPIENRILAALPRAELNRLLPDLAPVRLPQGKVLWDADDHIRHAFFLMGGMVSLLSFTEEGACVEVGMIGSEGLAGIFSILRFDAAPYRVVVQLPTAAMRIRVAALRREFARDGRLQDLLLRYTYTLLTQVSQSASCNRFHTAEERLCRWLLTSGDHAKSDIFPLTQEFLAQMIGAPRTSVTTVASRLQRMGLIRYRRGKIRILDRHGLENFSCECYKVINEGLSRYLAA